MVRPKGSNSGFSISRRSSPASKSPFLGERVCGSAERTRKQLGSRSLPSSIPVWAAHPETKPGHIAASPRSKRDRHADRWLRRVSIRFRACSRRKHFLRTRSRRFRCSLATIRIENRHCVVADERRRSRLSHVRFTRYRSTDDAGDRSKSRIYEQKRTQQAISRG